MKLKILIEKPRRLVYPRHNSHNKWCPRHRKNKVQMLGSFVEREKNTHRMRYRDKSLSRVWGKDHPETAPPRDASHVQLHNPDTIVDAHKCWVTGAGYSCHLGGSASAWQTQRGTLSAGHCTEHRVPNGGARERTQGAEGVCSATGGTTIWLTQYSPEHPGTKPSTKECTGS